MKLVISPAVDDVRLVQICETAGKMSVANVAEPTLAIQDIVDADAFFGRLNREMLSVAQRLRWVQTPTASLEHYMFPELVEHPCVLTNMRGLYSDVIADHVFAYILCFSRNLHIYWRQQQVAKWAPVGQEDLLPDFTMGPATISSMDRAHRHVSDCTLGIVGLGNIGAEVALRGLAFGMRVIAVDPRQIEASEGIDWLADLERLDELLAESDFVVVAAPHTPDTENMFQLDRFRTMKRDAYLINIGRGAIVDLASLVQALQQQEIAGAALDVFEQEPLPPEHPLWAMENVIITPHVAAASVHIAERHLTTLLDNIARFRDGRPLRNQVDKANWF